MSNQGGNTPKICTVIGFPNGYNTTEIKVFETRNAVENGAEEIDMVINIGWLKEKQWDKIESEIAAIRQACEGKILKVIIETCLLNTDEKFMMCKLVSRSGADYIKTSTGFSTGGATKEDIAFFSEHISNGLKIKAAGGISSFEDAEAMIKLGASRLGTSRLVKLALKSGKDDKSDSSY
jgi:deoxyribose-phosphate aldolase